MLKKWPFKKEYLLISASIILLLISYQLAFKRTMEAWQLHASLKNQLSQSVDLSVQPQYIERKSANLAKVINLYKADTVNFRSNIISTISSIADKENVKLSEVPTEDPQFHTSRFIIQKLGFEGDYFSLIRTFNRLQSTNGVGIVRSAMLKVKSINSNNDTKKLSLEVYFEITTN